jgi:hypothetical protein
MPDEPSQPFQPPAPEQFQAYLRDHPANPLSPWQLRAPWLIALVLFALSFATVGPASAILSLAALFWFITHTSIRSRRAMSLQTRARRTQETAMLRRYTDALRLAWQLLPNVAAAPQVHGQTVAMIAHTLDSLGHYDAAIVGYDHLLSRLPLGQPITVHIAVSRAAAALGAERLSDADEAIRRLRGPVEPFEHTPISAAYRLAKLTQQVRTHHFNEGVQESPGLIDDLRPLGVEAGYGHALMALCHYHDNNAITNHSNPQHDAKSWWQQATLLLPPDTLLQRFPELAPLTELS